MGGIREQRHTVCMKVHTLNVAFYIDVAGGISGFC